MAMGETQAWSHVRSPWSSSRSISGRAPARRSKVASTSRSKRASVWRQSAPVRDRPSNSQRSRRRVSSPGGSQVRARRKSVSKAGSALWKPSRRSASASQATSIEKALSG